MSKYEHIETSIWSQPGFEDLSVEARYTFLWTITNPRCNVAGLYPISVPHIAFETKLSVEQVEGALAALAAARLVYYDEGFLFIRRRVLELHTRGPNHAKSIVKD